jgi:exosortase
MSVSQRTIALVSTGVLLLCYAATLRGMIGQWASDEDMGHGFLVPLAVGWIVWRERGRWMKLDPSPSRWGFAILGVGAIGHAAGSMGVGLFAASVAMLVSAIGGVVAIGGFRFLRAWAFPLLLSLFMLPKLAVVYNQATLPLQLTASRLAAAMLSATGSGVVRDGNILQIAGRRIWVAEACSGIRYLLPLAFMALLIAYLRESKPAAKVAIVVLSVPFAIVANAVRVAAAARFPAFEEGIPHVVAGLVIFGLCLGCLMFTCRLIEGIYARHT